MRIGCSLVQPCFSGLKLRCPCNRVSLLQYMACKLFFCSTMSGRKTREAVKDVSLLHVHACSLIMYEAVFFFEK